MKYILPFIAILYFLSGSACKTDPANNSESVAELKVLIEDTIVAIQEKNSNELIATYGTDSIRKIEQLRRDSIKRILEENKKESKNNNKPCDQILKDYEDFLKNYSGKFADEKLKKELKAWIEDVPFQSCLKSNIILNNLKDSLEDIYL
jgi:hypothetical protein